ncbi:MAG: 30S ribosomal protein S8 [Dehalococcoidia bacterium]
MDIIGDMLTRIRNANMVKHESAQIPASRLRIAIAKVLKDEGYINEYEILKGDTPQKVLKIHLRYIDNKEPVVTGLERVSRPGCRVYAGKEEIPRVYGGLGIAIVSTTQGIMTGKKARRRGVGGEVLCKVW